MRMSPRSSLAPAATGSNTDDLGARHLDVDAASEPDWPSSEAAEVLFTEHTKKDRLAFRASARNRRSVG